MYSPIKQRREFSNRNNMMFKSMRKSRRFRYSPASSQIRQSSDIFVTGYPLDMTEEEFYQIFSKFGPIYKICIKRDHETGRKRNYMFIGYYHLQDAREAIKVMDGQMVSGKRFVVKHSRSRYSNRSKWNWQYQNFCDMRSSVKSGPGASHFSKVEFNNNVHPNYYVSINDKDLSVARVPERLSPPARDRSAEVEREHYRDTEKKQQKNRDWNGEESVSQVWDFRSPHRACLEEIEIANENAGSRHSTLLKKRRSNQLTAIMKSPLKKVSNSKKSANVWGQDKIWGEAVTSPSKKIDDEDQNSFYQKLFLQRHKERLQEMQKYYLSSAFRNRHRTNKQLGPPSRTSDPEIVWRSGREKQSNCIILSIDGVDEQGEEAQESETAKDGNSFSFMSKASQENSKQEKYKESHKLIDRISESNQIYCDDLTCLDYSESNS